MPRPAAFLDRDGVLNHRIPGDTYVTRPDELVVLPHAAEGIRMLRARGYEVVVVITNQQGVGRGFMTLADVDAVHETLRATLAADGAPLDAIYRCPHRKEEGCACRKPAPGMILQAAADLDLDLPRSVLVGDTERDAEAGRAAGVGLCLLIESDGDLREAVRQTPDVAHIAAHRRSIRHRAELEASARCGCFYCLATFPPGEIADWIDQGATALCPRCGIDAVIGAASGYPIERPFLERMREHWFWA